MAVTAYATSTIMVKGSVTYRGPKTSIILHFALVDSGRNTVPGPSGNHLAEGANGFDVTDGQTLDVSAGLVNNGSIPQGSYDVLAIIYTNDWQKVLYTSPAGSIGTVNVVQQSVSGSGFGVSVS